MKTSPSSKRHGPISSQSEFSSDVCFIFEGSYPYVNGGVASWAQAIIENQPHLTFDIVALLAPQAEAELKFVLPKNVVKVTNITLQKMPDSKQRLPRKLVKKFYQELELGLIHVVSDSSSEWLRRLMNTLYLLPFAPGANVLMDSRQVWSVVMRMYRAMMGDTCFLDYFWSWRALFGGQMSVLLADLPKSRVYHSASTGYAGLLLSRAAIETGMPAILTEHGIYTNERRIEICMAEWLPDSKALNLNIDKEINDRSLRDFWIDTFAAYSNITYEFCETIITLYQGNFTFQIADGADPRKLRVIPNSVETARYLGIPQKTSGNPTIALVGRVVPIKDTKTFIRACALVTEEFMGFRALIVGPYDEDPEYFNECVDLVKQLALETVVEFTGKRDMIEIYEKIDILVLTSISEAMPLVILEAGAAGVPSVATNVGACRELLFGVPNESPARGPGGIITELANPVATAAAIVTLLKDPELCRKYGQTMRERVQAGYDTHMEKKAYAELYDSMLTITNTRLSASPITSTMVG